MLHQCFSRINAELTRHNNDIALLKVKPVWGSTIKFSDHVQPACLPDADTEYAPGQRCHISGWGSVVRSRLGRSEYRVNVNRDDWDIVGMGLACSGVSGEQRE